MTSIATAYKYIHLDDLQVPIVAGTTMKVVEIIIAQKAYGWSPEEVHFQHPYLSMSQIYSALASIGIIGAKWIGISKDVLILLKVFVSKPNHLT
jgi:uncharacterized protein (DUF433 family)